MVVIMRLWKKLVFLCPKWSWTFLRPNSFKFGFPLPICNIHLTGVSTEPGGAYSSGAPGITSISEVHVFTQFCHIERPKDLRLRNTALVLLYFNWNKLKTVASTKQTPWTSTATTTKHSMYSSNPGLKIYPLVHTYIYIYMCVCLCALKFTCYIFTLYLCYILLSNSSIIVAINWWIRYL